MHKENSFTFFLILMELSSKLFPVKKSINQHCYDRCNKYLITNSNFKNLISLNRSIITKKRSQSSLSSPLLFNVVIRFHSTNINENQHQQQPEEPLVIKPNFKSNI